MSGLHKQVVVVFVLFFAMFNRFSVLNHVYSLLSESKLAAVFNVCNYFICLWVPRTEHALRESARNK
jgi:hypothetical protein